VGGRHFSRIANPGVVLRGEIEALLEGIRPINPEAIRSLHGETLRLQRLIEDLYQLALSDLGTLTYHKKNLDPVEVLDDSLMSYQKNLLESPWNLAQTLQRKLVPWYLPTRHDCTSSSPTLR